MVGGGEAGQVLASTGAAPTQPSLDELLRGTRILAVFRELTQDRMLCRVDPPCRICVSPAGKPVYSVSLTLDRRLTFTRINEGSTAISLAAVAIFCPSQPLLCWLDMAVNYTAACNPAFLDGSAAAGRGHTAAYRALPAPARAAIALVSLRHLLAVESDSRLSTTLSLTPIPFSAIANSDPSDEIYRALSEWLSGDVRIDNQLIFLGDDVHLQPERIGFVESATHVFLGVHFDNSFSPLIRMVLGLSSLARFLVPPAAVQKPFSPYNTETWLHYDNPRAREDAMARRRTHRRHKDFMQLQVEMELRYISLVQAMRKRTRLAAPPGLDEVLSEREARKTRPFTVAVVYPRLPRECAAAESPGLPDPGLPSVRGHVEAEGCGREERPGRARCAPEFMRTVPAHGEADVAPSGSLRLRSGCARRLPRPRTALHRDPL
jgi:hypothetical protein